MKPLKVAIVHHHLRGGGVTRVIQRTIEALQSYPVEICIISGEEPVNPGIFPGVKIGVIPGLSYGPENPMIDPSVLYDNVINKAQKLLSGEPDVWHIHNHTLGKNVQYTEVALMLAKRENPVCYHLHDFAEDNRPSNYKYLNTEISDQGKLYPVGDHIIYGILNDRDHDILKKAGLEDSRIHVWSNPVVAESKNVEEDQVIRDPLPGKKIYLYPVRVIPRKNIGEVALWALLAEENEHFAVTLAPKNPKYKSFYSKWVEFVDQHQLPLTFEAGKKWGLNYPELLQRADGIITTSIAEGFGLVYLESWLMNKPLFGRLLPEITRDFKSAGIEFPGMYTGIDIPLDWLDRKELHKTLDKAILKMIRQYGVEANSILLSEWKDKIIQNDRIDFGKLNSQMQRSLIHVIMKNPELKKEIPSLKRNIPDTEVINRNREVVAGKYGIKEYGEMIFNVYSDLSNRKPGGIDYLDQSVILKQFLSPAQFSLLRS